MAEKEKNAPVVMVRYRVMADCVYDHTWYGAGTILEFPESVKVEHDMILPINGNDVTDDPLEIYDPQAEFQKRNRLNKAYAGIVR